MRHWVTRVLVLLFAIAWFGVVVPGHQRGAISLPGSTVNDANLPPCHRKKVPAAPDTPKKPTQCLICTLAAMTSPPPAIDSIPQHSFREALVVASPRLMFAPPLPLPSSERGPPMA